MDNPKRNVFRATDGAKILTPDILASPARKKMARKNTSDRAAFEQKCAQKNWSRTIAKNRGFRGATLMGKSSKEKGKTGVKREG